MTPFDLHLSSKLLPMRGGQAIVICVQYLS